MAPTAMPKFVYGKEPSSSNAARILSRLVDVCAQNAITTNEMIDTSTGRLGVGRASRHRVAGALTKREASVEPQDVHGGRREAKTARRQGSEGAGFLCKRQTSLRSPNSRKGGRVTGLMRPRSQCVIKALIQGRPGLDSRSTSREPHDILICRRPGPPPHIPMLDIGHIVYVKIDHPSCVYGWSRHVEDY